MGGEQSSSGVEVGGGHNTFKGVVEASGMQGGGGIGRTPGGFILGRGGAGNSSSRPCFFWGEG